MYRLLTIIIILLSLICQAMGKGDSSMDESRLSGKIIFSADLTEGPDKFVFRDDIFGCGTKGAAEGRWEPPSGKLAERLLTRIQPSEGMEAKPVSGGWSLPVTLSESGLVSIDIRYWVSTSRKFEPNQSVDALLTVDGHPVACNSYGSLVRVRPSEMGDNGTLGTGWQEAALDMYLPAGSHTVRLGLRASEGLAPGTWSRMLVDRIEIRKAASVSFTGDGGFVIHSGDHDFASGSLFSRPGGGWYRIGADASPQNDAVRWQIKPVHQTGSKWEGTAKTPQFSLHRTIHVDGHRVQVEDTLTNLSNKDLGWMIRNELAVPTDPESTPNVHLGGDSRLDPSIVYTRILKDGDRVTGIDCWRPSNPTVFVPFPDTGVGLLIEDDVTRVHSFTYWRRLSPDRMTFGLRDENFALPPGGKYTMRWTAYIIPGAEKTYYDFINQVRADRGLNDIRIPGPTAWSSFINAMQTMKDEDIQSRLRKSGVWAVATSLNGWIYPDAYMKRTDPEKIQIGFGPGVLDPYYAPLRETWARESERIHRLAPDVKVIHYFHTFLYDPPRDTDSFKDSWVTRRDGAPAINDWGGLVLTPSMQVYPTKTNAVGKGMLKVLDEMSGPMNGNGIYFDEVNYPTGIGWMDFFPYTFNAWDGHSAILDPKTFAIVQKCGYLELLSGDFKKMLFKRLDKKGLIVLGNGAPDTWWEDELKFPRHTECRTDPYPRAYESHLYSPIALVEDRSFKHTREMLRYGVIDCFVRLEDPDLARQEHIIRSFPLTVQEIHSGWLKGKERIITMLSGKYSWNESARARIYEFNADGVLSATSDGYVSTDGTFNITVPEDGLVIIERIASE